MMLDEGLDRFNSLDLEIKSLPLVEPLMKHVLMKSSEAVQCSDVMAELLPLVISHRCDIYFKVRHLLVLTPTD